MNEKAPVDAEMMDLARATGDKGLTCVCPNLRFTPQPPSVAPLLHAHVTSLRAFCTRADNRPNCPP